MATIPIGTWKCWVLGSDGRYKNDSGSPSSTKTSTPNYTVTKQDFGTYTKLAFFYPNGNSVGSWVSDQYASYATIYRFESTVPLVAAPVVAVPTVAASTLEKYQTYSPLTLPSSPGTYWVRSKSTGLYYNGGLAAGLSAAQTTSTPPASPNYAVSKTVSQVAITAVNTTNIAYLDATQLSAYGEYVFVSTTLALAPPAGAFSPSNVPTGLYFLQVPGSSPAQYFGPDLTTVATTPTFFVIKKTASNLTYSSFNGGATGTIAFNTNAYWFVSVPGCTLAQLPTGISYCQLRLPYSTPTYIDPNSTSFTSVAGKPIGDGFTVNKSNMSVSFSNTKGLSWTESNSRLSLETQGTYWETYRSYIFEPLDVTFDGAVNVGSTMYDMPPGSYFGWKNFSATTDNFSVSFTAITPSGDLCVGLKDSDGVVHEICIGTDGNTQSRVEGVVVTPATTQGYSATVPDSTFPVKYTVSITNSGSSSNGTLFVRGTKRDGAIVNIISYQLPSLNKQFTSYSFRTLNNPIKVGADSLTFLPPFGVFISSSVPSGNYWIQKPGSSPVQYLASDGVTWQSNKFVFALSKNPSNLTYYSYGTTSSPASGIGTLSLTDMNYWFVPIPNPSENLTLNTVQTGSYFIMQPGSQPAQYLTPDGNWSLDKFVFIVNKVPATNFSSEHIDFVSKLSGFSRTLFFGDTGYWFIPVVVPSGFYTADTVVTGNYYLQQEGSSPAQYMSADGSVWQSTPVAYSVFKSNQGMNISSLDGSIAFTLTVDAASVFWFVPIPDSVQASAVGVTQGLYSASSVTSGDYWIQRAGTSSVQYLSADGTSWKLYPSVYSVVKNPSSVAYTSKAIPTVTGTILSSSTAFLFASVPSPVSIDKTTPVASLASASSVPASTSVAPPVSVGVSRPDGSYAPSMVPDGVGDYWILVAQPNNPGSFMYLTSQNITTTTKPLAANFVVTKARASLVWEVKGNPYLSKGFGPSDMAGIESLYLFEPGFFAPPEGAEITYTIEQLPLGTFQCWAKRPPEKPASLVSVYSLGDGNESYARPALPTFIITKDATQTVMTVQATGVSFTYAPSQYSTLNGYVYAPMLRSGTSAAQSSDAGALPVVPSLPAATSVVVPQAATTSYSAKTLPLGTTDCWIKYSTLYQTASWATQREKPALPTHSVTKTSGQFEYDGITLCVKGNEGSGLQIPSVQYSGATASALGAAYSFEVVAPFDLKTTASLIADSKAKIVGFDLAGANTLLDTLKNKLATIKSSSLALSSVFASALASAQAFYDDLSTRIAKRPVLKDIDDLTAAYKKYADELAARIFVTDLVAAKNATDSILRSIVIPLSEVATAFESARQYFIDTIPGIPSSSFIP